MTIVYVIQAEGGPVKVGVARDPEKRLDKLKTGSPFRLRLAHVQPVNGLNALAVERGAHALLNSARAHGEWFDTSAEAAKDAITAAIDLLRRGEEIPYPSTRCGEVIGRQIAAARTLVGITQAELAASANLSVPTLKRMEGSDGPAAGLPNNVGAVVRALEAAGVEFTNGGQPGVRLKQQEA